MAPRLMLLPIYLGICSAGEFDAAHRASATLMAHNIVTAGLVSLVHTIAMVIAGGAMALMRSRMARPGVYLP